jgi:thiol:disulfide interchange protein DsbC
MTRTLLSLAFTLLVSAQINVSAAPAQLLESAAVRNKAVEMAVADAQKQMQATFTNVAVKAFRSSPIPGLYEADIGGRLVYYSASPEMLIFGTIFDPAGTNLTAASLERSLRGKLAQIDTTVALTLTNGDGPSVVEFTNPDCPYCRSLETWWAAKASEGKKFQRKIFFAIGPGFKDAATKAEHILCSANPADAMKFIYGGGEPKQWLQCDAGRKQLEAHSKSAAAAGVSGTPTIIAGSTLISGYKVADLEVFLNQPTEKKHVSTNAGRK